MSAGRVVFAFSDGLNFALNKEEIDKGVIVKFNSGFDRFEVTCKESVLSLINSKEVQDQIPAVEIALKQEIPLSRVARVERVTTAQRIYQVESVVTTPLSLPAQFREGTPRRSGGPRTRTQRRNDSRRVRRRFEDLGLPSRKLPSLVVVPEEPRDASSNAIPAVEEYVPQYVESPRRQQITFRNEVQRARDVRKQCFHYYQHIDGRTINILEGLELHTGVFSEHDQNKIVDAVYEYRERGRAGLLRPKTYSEPRKWIRGKGRITIQFGCCYNFAVDAEGNQPGILQHADVDPLPPLLLRVIKRLVAWHVLPPEVTPDSCIVNIYEEGDCIPPHVDSHDFLRPFCTVSFLGECNIMFGTELRIEGPGEFSGSVKIPLPLGSVLVLAGNGADVAKHCVPGVPRRRISLTFRKMKEDRHPYKYTPEPELQGLLPLIL